MVLGPAASARGLPAPGGLPLLAGRPQLGLLATAVPDLNLACRMMLGELRLPARLAKYVLSAAVRTSSMKCGATDSDDWLTLVRGAGAVPRERIEDYVAAAAADGPLVIRRLVGSGMTVRCRDHRADG